MGQFAGWARKRSIAPDALFLPESIKSINSTSALNHRLYTEGIRFDNMTEVIGPERVQARFYGTARHNQKTSTTVR